MTRLLIVLALAGCATIPVGDTNEGGGGPMPHINYLIEGAGAISTSAPGVSQSPTFSGTLTAGAITATSGTISARSNGAGFSFGTAGTQYFGMAGGSQTISLSFATMALASAAIQLDSNSSIQGPSSHILINGTAPTISSGFGTSPSIVTSNGTGAFQVNVGTGGTANSGVIGLPAATTGWVCQCTDITTNSTSVDKTKQTATSTTSCTVGNFSDVSVATAWVASDKLQCSAFAY